MPTGPVTHPKAWIEMIHRYLAGAITVLATLLAGAGWYQTWRGRQTASAWWPTATWFWVCLQGAFGALTVTMKLYPAIVTGHLLGGLGLLMLLAVQAQGYATPLRLSRRLRWALWGVLGLTLAQATLGGWVSTNYAVLACTDFPTCQGHWWPPMDFTQGFAVRRPLGLATDGGLLPFSALTAIHFIHRLGAGVLVAAIALLAWRLHASGDAPLRRWALWLGAAVLWQVASGLGNVVLGWPLLAALSHTGGAAALLTLLTVMLARARQAARP